MKCHNFPVLRMLLPYLVGIMISYFFVHECLNFLIFIVSCVLFLSIALLLRLRFPLVLPSVPTLFLATVSFLLGIVLTNFRYCPVHWLDKQKMVENCRDFTVQVMENPVEKEKTVRLMVHLQSDREHHPVHLNAMLYLQKNQEAIALQPGDQLVVHANFREIAPPSNPYSFDYKSYMKRKSVFFTGYASATQWKRLSRSPTRSVGSLASKIQRHFSSLFAQNGLQGEEYAVITAVLLGDDDNMEPELKAHYASAGVSHILCVSGMHVGIIFMIVGFLLKPMERFPRLVVLRAALLLLLIWCYAHITGLAPSVKRAATMFSFVILGSLLHRPTSIFHSLFSSMFVILLFNPLLVFEIGFQMSYLAVFGIVLLQPPLSSLWTPKNKVIKYLWELATVSVAAQLATFPLSIYYFGQFPNYFLLSNMAVISLSFLVVMTGIFLLVFSWIPPLSRIIGWLLTYEIRLLNSIVKGVESLPGSVTDDIALPFPSMLLIYGIIIAVFLLYKEKKLVYKYLTFTFILAFGISLLTDCIVAKNKHQMTFYALEKMSAVECNSATRGVLFLDSSAMKSPIAYDFNIKNQIRKQHIENEIFKIDTSFVNCQFLAKKNDFLLFEEKTVFFLSNYRRIYPLPDPVKVDVLCLQHNPHISMNRLLRTFTPRIVLIDGTNSPYYEQRWIDSCEAYRIPYHSTRREGYFSL